MRLKRLWIDGFKNLNNFKIDFENRGGITVLIGNNASGKSNVLEAISAIFAGIYNNNLEKLNFKFNLIYYINERDIKISKKQKLRYRIKKPKINTWNKLEKLYSLGSPYDYRPSQAVALYSGEELRLWEDYYQKFYFDFNNKSLKDDIYLSEQKMLYINKYYWDIALLTMYASDMDADSSIEKIIGSNLKTINLEVNIDNLSKFLKQKPYNVVNNFIWDLMRPDDWFAEDLTIAEVEDKISDEYDIPQELTFNLNKFQSKSSQKTHTELFKLLCVAKLPKDLKHRLITNLELHFENGTTTKDLSEGQKKQILLKLALEVLADENSLLLFDEPDAHIHIANKKLIPDMLKEYEGKREVVLTTHSPTLAHSFDNKNLAYIENGKINEDYNTKEKLLNELTNGLMGVSEQQILLQSDKDILIVEGKTDEDYISQALKVLGKDNSEYKDLDFNFLWLGGSDADNLNKIIKEFKPKENQTIIAFFDRDSNGKGCVKKVLGMNIEEDFIGEKKEDIHVYLYPKKDGFKNSNFEVEDYFPIEVLRHFIFDKSITFQDLKGKFSSKKKVEFSKKCQENNFKKSNFNGFKKLFDLILEIKTS